MSDPHFQIVCDNTVLDGSGKVRIIESMHSALRDLSTDHDEVLARIHPVRRKFFDAVCAGEKVEVAMNAGNGGKHKVEVHRDISIRVNQPQGGVAKLAYASLAGRGGGAVRGEVLGKGFDANAEPIIRQMQDRSFRLVFCTMPPRQHVLGEAFDMEAFGEGLVSSVKAKLVWDDRDVFYFETASADEVREILVYLRDYGKPGAGVPSPA
ncbi:MAG: hypothetical protein V4582_02105 [Pseudomonadota bacterium]